MFLLMLPEALKGYISNILFVLECVIFEETSRSPSQGGVTPYTDAMDLKGNGEGKEPKSGLLYSKDSSFNSTREMFSG